MKKLLIAISLITLNTSCEKTEQLAKEWSQEWQGNTEVSVSPAPEISEQSEQPSESIEPSASTSPEASSSSAISTPEASASPTDTSMGTQGLRLQVKNHWGEALNNALITLDSSLKQGWTFDQGEFFFKDLQPGNYKIHVNKEGYIPQSVSVVLNEGTQITQVHLSPRIERLQITPSQPRIVLGQSLKPEAVIFFQDGSTSRQVTWAIEDENIAKMNTKGEIEGLKAGKTYLKVKLGKEEVKSIELEVVRYVFNIIGTNRLDLRSKGHFVADPPTHGDFANATYEWSVDPSEGIQLIPHPAAPNIVIVSGERAGEFVLTATLKTSDLTLNSKPLNLSIEE